MGGANNNLTKVEPTPAQVAAVAAAADTSTHIHTHTYTQVRTHTYKQAHEGNPRLKVNKKANLKLKTNDTKCSLT